ncbi:MAG: hypothetical protein OXB98_13780 [Bryobacterales bacterium]|nr:hypothetical protein [Bryobacterales bacterium]
MPTQRYQTISEAWQMICPECHRDDNIRIFATVEVVLTPQGTDEAEDSTTVWDNHNSAYCNRCGYSGILQGFRDAHETLQRKTP